MKQKAILIVMIVAALSVNHCKDKGRSAPADSKTVAELPADLVGQYCSASRCDRLELTVKADYIDFLGVECIVEKVETSASFTTAHCKELDDTDVVKYEFRKDGGKLYSKMYEDWGANDEVEIKAVPQDILDKDKPDS